MFERDDTIIVIVNDQSRSADRSGIQQSIHIDKRHLFLALDAGQVRVGCRRIQAKTTREFA